MRSSGRCRSVIASLLALQFIFAFATCAQTDSQYAVATPGYRYEFPRDHFDHPEYQTEWWYYTGNVASADGRHFGFELTFFRQGVDRGAAKKGAWNVHDLYLAQLA